MLDEERALSINGEEAAFSLLEVQLAFMNGMPGSVDPPATAREPRRKIDDRALSPIDRQIELVERRHLRALWQWELRLRVTPNREPLAEGMKTLF